MTAALPTPPQPITATESPRPTAPVLTAAPIPAITPQPSSPATDGDTDGSTLVHCPAATRVFSAKAPIPRAGVSTVPFAVVIFCRALWVSKQYQGRPRRRRPAPAAHRTPVEDHEVAGRNLGDAVPDLLDQAGGLVPEQVGEVLADPALPVVQVGVADPARLDPHHRLAGTRVRHRDRLDPHPLALAGREHPADFLCHG